MGLGKTLQSVTLIHTLLKTGTMSNKEPTAKRIIVVCPCSLVKNWDNKFIKWLGPGVVKTLALAESDRKSVEKSMDLFVRTKMFNVLIVSYETLRTRIVRLNNVKNSCNMLVCDEAHRLKNSESQTSRALALLPCRRRVLLTGTPMQNDLQEFFAMVDFTNPGVLGTQEEFRRNILFPILRGKEPDATTRQRERMMGVQNDMSLLVNNFILRRVNTLNAQHLPPKLVQVVCCNLTGIQQNMYQQLVSSKDMQHVLDGKQVNCLSSIQMLMKLVNHHRLVANEDDWYGGGGMGVGGRRAASFKKVSYCEDKKSRAGPGADRVSKFMPLESGGGGMRGNNAPVRPGELRSKYAHVSQRGYFVKQDTDPGKFSGVNSPFWDISCILYVNGPRRPNPDAAASAFISLTFAPPPNPPEWSGKMFVLYRLMREMRKPGNGNDKIVIVSNYTQTLNLIGRMCRENTWGFCRLDGSITMKKRQKMVSERAMRV